MYVAYTDKQPVNVNSLAPNGPDSELFTVESVLASAGSIGFIHRRWLDDHSVETISGGELGFGDSTSWWGQEPAAKSYVIRNHRLQVCVVELRSRCSHGTPASVYCTTAQCAQFERVHVGIAVGCAPGCRATAAGV